MGSSRTECPRCKTGRYATLTTDAIKHLRYFCGNCKQYFQIPKKGN